MSLFGLTKFLENRSDYKDLLESLNLGGSGPVNTDIPFGAKPFLITSIWKDLVVPVVWIHSTPQDARKSFSQIKEYAGQSLEGEYIYYYPEPDALPYENLNSDRSVVWDRLRILYILSELPEQIEDSHLNHVQTRPLIVTSVNAISRITLELEKFTLESEIIKLGDTVDLEKLLNSLVRRGYESVASISTPGTFSRRGGIIDIWSPQCDSPVRLELDGYMIESIREFDSLDQRSTDKIEMTCIIPARELIPSTNFETKNIDENASLAVTEVVNKYVLSKKPITEAEIYSNSEFYTHLFHAGTFFDYLPQQTLLIHENQDKLLETWRQFNQAASDQREHQILSSNIENSFPNPIIQVDKFESTILRDSKALNFKPFSNTAKENTSIRRAVTIDFGELNSFEGNIQALSDALYVIQDSGAQIVLCSLQAERLSDLLASHGHKSSILDRIENLQEFDGIILYPGSFLSGWILESTTNSSEDKHLAFFTDQELFGVSKNKYSGFRKSIRSQKTIDEFEIDDLIVHIEHGIGKFKGLIKRSLDESEREYLVMAYANDDLLYVPTSQIDRVARYVGAGSTPKLSSLGGREWGLSKKKASKAAADFARELLRLNVAREIGQRPPMNQSDPWEWELENSFPYQETPDQIRALEEINADLESTIPMDRLLCGDVGFGKTEIALRTAFKAVNAGFQVAVLVPTTVLAQQHYVSFSERLNIFSTKIAMLSRLQSDSKNRDTLSRISSGDVDIVIGTHKLLSKDVHFKKLGLIIIDEEQRFGVRQKEHLKSVRATVDVLTMTATPIPRTLHMALFGVKDMSRIETPPEERLPVSTRVTEYDDQIVRDALLKEINRGGQVYFVHNRVNTIFQKMKKLEILCPEISFSVAHGQMQPKEIEEVMESFSTGQINVLICTTIVQSGLDIPNANTLIVEDSDKLGLTQLYQLRGRVGRSPVRAYAFFLFKRTGTLTELAEKRLRTILSTQSLGSGYQLAMKDLQIRGSGDILGADQSGHVSTIGFDLYTKLLAQAVEEARGGTGNKISKQKDLLIQPTVKRPPVELGVDAYIPDYYVTDVSTRLSIYERLLGAGKDFDSDALLEEFTDRFGEPPQNVKDLVLAVYLRTEISSMEGEIKSIIGTKSEITINLKKPYDFNKKILISDKIHNIEIGNAQMRLVNLLDPDNDWRVNIVNLIQILKDTILVTA